MGERLSSGGEGGSHRVCVVDFPYDVGSGVEEVGGGASLQGGDIRQETGPSWQGKRKKTEVQRPSDRPSNSPTTQKAFGRMCDASDA